MGMSTRILAVIEADSEWIKMKQAWEACEDAGVTIPKELFDYFDGVCPKNMNGKEINLNMYKNNHESLDLHDHDYIESFIVDISKLPKGTKKIKIEHHW